MGASDHPLEWAARLADRLAEGRTSPAGALDAVLHRVERRCEQCNETLAAYPRQKLLTRAATWDREDLERAVAEGAASALELAADRDDALELFEELLTDAQPDRAVTQAAFNPRFHRWGFAVLCCEWADELLVEEPPSALPWARLAVATADAMDRARYGSSVVDDLRGLARSALARALLVHEPESGTAGLHARRALELLARGSRPAPLWTAASLAAVEVELAHGAWPRALAVADLLRAQPSVTGDPDVSVRLDRLTAAALKQGSSPERAAWTLRRAVRVGAELTGPAHEHARLANSELVHLLCDAERYGEAGAVLEKHPRRFTRQGPDPSEAHLAWAGARWLASTGSPGADGAFEQARKRLAAVGDALAAARATADHLAYRITRPGAGHRAADDARPLLTAMVDLYLLPTLPRAAAATLLVLQRRAWEDGMSAEAVEDARAALALPPGSGLLGGTPDGSGSSVH